MILRKISTAIYLYGFLNQSLGLILGNIFLIKIMACVPLTVLLSDKVGIKHQSINQLVCHEK